MLHLLLQLAGYALLSVVVAVVRRRRADRRRAEVETGGAATCRAGLSIGDGRFRTGALLLSGARVVWQSKRGTETYELSGEHPPRYGRDGDILLRLALPGRVSARIVLSEDDAATLAGLLPRTDPSPPGAALPDFPAPRRRPWAVALLALAGLWTFGWIALVLDGETVTATVTGGDGAGGCTVVWHGDDGRSYEDHDVDCDDPPAGSNVTVWALGWPATGDAEDPTWTVGGVTFVAALIAAPGAISLLRTRRRLRRPLTTAAPSLPEAATQRVTVPLQNAPALSAEDLRPLPAETPEETLRRLAPRAARQIPADGWEHPGLPAGDGPPQLLTRLFRALRWPGALLAGAVVLTWLLTGSWYVLQTSTTTTARGISTGEVTESHWPLPDQVTVRFRTSDRGEHVADVATLTSLPKGRAVTVEYAVTDPGSARLVGPPDGLGRSVTLTLAAVALLLLWGINRIRSTLADMHGVRMAAQNPPNPALGLLTADSRGRPLLIACSPLTSPLELYAVPLEAPLPHGTAALFVANLAPELRLHGRLAEGETVVPELGRAVLWPAGPAWLPDADDLLGILDSVGALDRSADD